LLNFGSYVKNDYFLKGVLVSLQNQLGPDGTVEAVDSSACLKAYDEFEATTASMDAAMVMSVYTAAREAKGQGSGTNMGFMVSNFGSYQELLVSGFDFYNDCNLDYYMVAIGSSSQNPTGIANLAVALGYRAFSGEDSTLADLASASAAFLLSTTNDNATAFGNASGALIRVLLQVEIPTTSDNEIAYY
jgi:hypothetical protein